jgi:hypothetical protein
MIRIVDLFTNQGRKITGPKINPAADNCHKKVENYQLLQQQQHIRFFSKLKIDFTAFRVERLFTWLEECNSFFIICCLYSSEHSESGIGTGFPTRQLTDLKLVARGSQSLSLTSSL